MRVTKKANFSPVSEKFKKKQTKNQFTVNLPVDLRLIIYEYFSSPQMNCFKKCNHPMHMLGRIKQGVNGYLVITMLIVSVC